MGKRSLKGIRCDLGYTQEEMAKKLEMSVNSYKNRESFRSSLLAEELIALSEIAGIDPRDVILRKPK